MRPLTILHTEASTGWGGQEIRIITESVGMIQRGHRVLLACKPESVIAQEAAEQGIEVHTMPIGGAFDFRGIERLRDLIRREKIQIVNPHSSKDGWTAGLAGKLAGVRVIRTRHLSIPIKPGFESRFLYGKLADVVVTTGESLRLHVMEAVGLSAERTVSIPTGLDLERFNPDAVDGTGFRAELGLDADTPLVGTVGMLRGMKGHEYFVRAAAQVLESVPEVRFVIVGDVAFKSSIKLILAELMDRLGITDKVHMVGYREDIPEVMAALDVFVLASVKHEGVPQVISQAMAMRKPVVATDVGSIAEQVVDGETGFLVEKEDADALARATLNLLRDRKLSARMGERGRRLAEKTLSMEAMLDATEALYSRLLVW